MSLVEQRFVVDVVPPDDIVPDLLSGLREPEQILVLRIDDTFFDEEFEVDGARPETLADKDDWKGFDLAGLNQGQCLNPSWPFGLDPRRLPRFAWLHNVRRINPKTSSNSRNLGYRKRHRAETTLNFGSSVLGPCWRRGTQNYPNHWYLLLRAA